MSRDRWFSGRCSAWFFLLLAVLLAAGACDGRPDGPALRPGNTAAPTSLQTATWPDCVRATPFWSEADQVVVDLDTSPCRLEFRKLLRLDGSDETVLPRPPLAIGPGGIFVTGTFQPGTLAVWDTDGSLLHSFGRGEGEGPGEFTQARGLVVSPDSVVHVFTSPLGWHLYALDGEFVGTASFPSTAVVAPSGVLGPGSGVASVAVLVESGGAEAGIFMWDGASVRPGGRFVTGDSSPPVVRASPGLGFWMSNQRELDLVRRTLPDGAEALRLGFVGGWKSEASPEANPPVRIFDLAPDDRGLLWYLVNVSSRDAPDGDMPPARSREELVENIRVFRDNIVEVATIDGRLIASRRYTDPGAIPRPITADLWYLVEDDLEGSIVIKEPVLVDP